MPGLLTEPVQDRGLAVVALDQLRQVRVKARRPHARTPRADGEQGDGRHRSSQADVETLTLGEELAPGHFSRRKTAPDDVGDERDSKGIVGTGGRDDRARGTRAPTEVAHALVVIDRQEHAGTTGHRALYRPPIRLATSR